MPVDRILSLQTAGVATSRCPYSSTQHPTRALYERLLDPLKIRDVITNRLELVLCPLFCFLYIIHYLGSSSSSVICQTTGPKTLAKRFLHTVRSRASSFNSQYPLLSLSSSSNFLHLLPCLLVTSICPFIFPSITCFRMQFLLKM